MSKTKNFKKEICHISLQKEQCKHSERNDQQITKVDFALQTLQNIDTKTML